MGTIILNKLNGEQTTFVDFDFSQQTTVDIMNTLNLDLFTHAFTSEGVVLQFGSTIQP